MTTWCCGDILLSDMSWEVWGAGWTGMRPYKSLSLPFKVFFFVMCSYIFKWPFSQSEDCNHCHHLRSSLLPNCLKQPAAICLPHYRRRHWQLERPRRPIIVVGVLMAGGRRGIENLSYLPVPLQVTLANTSRLIDQSQRININIFKI